MSIYNMGYKVKVVTLENGSILGARTFEASCTTVTNNPNGSLTLYSGETTVIFAPGQWASCTMEEIPIDPEDKEILDNI